MTCEKCWRDAAWRAQASENGVAAEYARLIEERKLRPCSPEEQAGPHAGECPSCGRLTLHQHAGRCTAGCDAAREATAEARARWGCGHAAGDGS